jgi:hypothetical protein
MLTELQLRGKVPLVDSSFMAWEVAEEIRAMTAIVRSILGISRWAE